MYKLVTASSPITPDKHAHILFEDSGSFSEFSLKHNDIISFELENSEEKFCTGWYDLKTSTHHPCEAQEKVTHRYQDCYICRNKTGFNPAFYNTSEISKEQEELNKLPHLVYIAYFGNGIAKAGITGARRGLKRLYEQGALFYTIIEEAPNAIEARKLEARLVRNGLKESVLKRTKSAVLENTLNLDKEEELFLNELKKAGQEGSGIQTNLDMFFFGNFLNEPIKQFSPDYPVSGKIKGVIGRYLILENNERLYGVWLSDFFGKKIQIKDEITELERDLQQVSLF